MISEKYQFEQSTTNINPRNVHEKTFKKGCIERKKTFLFFQIINFGIKGRPSAYTNKPAVYQIHTPDSRIATNQAE